MSFNSQIVLLENSKVSKVFGCNFFRVKSQVIKLVFGLASLRTFGLIAECGSLFAMCLGFKLPLLGLSLAQVGYSPLEGFITPLVLSRLFSRHSSPSTSLPYCAPNSFGESLLSLCYDLFLIICSADPV